MSDDRHNQRGTNPGGNEGRAIAALRRLPRAQASAEARARARVAFLAPAPVAETPVRPKRRSGFRRMTALLAAALLGAVAVFMIGRTPTAQWVVLDVVNPVGVSSPAGTDLAVGTRLDAGILATTAGSELELQLGERLRFRMLPGTRIELPDAPGRWFDRGRELLLTSGEIYGTTAGQALGFPMRFYTEELSATLTGTTFAVFRTDSTSCVCLWEGGITVIPLDDPDSPILLEAGQRVWVYKDERTPDVLPLNDMETMKLQMTQDAGLAAPLPQQP